VDPDHPASPDTLKGMAFLAALPELLPEIAGAAGEGGAEGGGGMMSNFTGMGSLLGSHGGQPVHSGGGGQQQPGTGGVNIGTWAGT
jgi:hypothetical protein